MQEERAIYDFGTLAPFPSASQCDGVDLFTNFEVHQFDYKTEEAKQALLVEYLQYVTKENYGTLKETEEWFIKRAEAMEGAHWEQIAGVDQRKPGRKTGTRDASK